MKPSSIGKPIALPRDHEEIVELRISPLERTLSGAPQLDATVAAEINKAIDPAPCQCPIYPWAIAIIAGLLLVTVVAVPDEWRIDRATLARDCRR